MLALLVDQAGKVAIPGRAGRAHAPPTGGAMPRTSVPRELFIPSELRPESAGWHPENGKAWQGYGVPYFTL